MKTKNDAQKEHAREYDRLRNAKPERREYKRNWYWANRDKELARKRKYREGQAAALNFFRVLVMAGSIH